jgi:hypothetical protein
MQNTRFGGESQEGCYQERHRGGRVKEEERASGPKVVNKKQKVIPASAATSAAASTAASIDAEEEVAENVAGGFASGVSLEGKHSAASFGPWWQRLHPRCPPGDGCRVCC